MKQLIEDFPVVFNGMSPWCSHNGVGVGWEPLIRELCQELTDILEEPGLVVMAQIKEKWSDLRWYMDWNRDVPKDEAKWEACYAAVAKAERKSSTTCELCGNVGGKTSKGWTKTLCNDCERLR